MLLQISLNVPTKFLHHWWLKQVMAVRRRLWSLGPRCDFSCTPSLTTTVIRERFLRTRDFVARHLVLRAGERLLLNVWQFARFRKVWSEEMDKRVVWVVFWRTSLMSGLITSENWLPLFDGNLTADDDRHAFKMKGKWHGHDVYFS